RSRAAGGREQLRLWVSRLDPFLPGGFRGGGAVDRAPPSSALDRRHRPRPAHERLRLVSRPPTASPGGSAGPFADAGLLPDAAVPARRLRREGGGAPRALDSAADEDQAAVSLGERDPPRRPLDPALGGLRDRRLKPG